MPLDLTPIEPDQLSPAVAKVVAGPAPAKMMAARGLMPMGPRDLATVLYLLSLDSDAKVAEAAGQAATKLPDKVLGPALGEALDARVLHFFAQKVASRPPMAEQVLLNKGVHDETLIYLARKLGERELEILAGNQQRILACPAIIEALYFNTDARMSTVKRLLELAVRHGMELDLPQFGEIRASILGEQQAAPDVDDETAAQMQALEDDVADEAFREAVEEADEAEAAEAAEEEEKKKHVRVLDLPLIQRIRLATTGQAYHRAELINDRNRSVSMAVIQNPGVTDGEAARFAANRNLSEEIIRFISRKKEWQKSYAVKLAMVQNPKTPMAAVMRYIPHLRTADLRVLGRSKNIPAAVAVAARKMLQKRS